MNEYRNISYHIKWEIFIVLRSHLAGCKTKSQFWICSSRGVGIKTSILL